MKILGLAVALFACLAALSGWRLGDATLEIAAAGALLCAYCAFRSGHVSRFLKIFVALFSVETIVFGLCDIAARFGYWPHALDEARVPDTLPLTVALFAVLFFAVTTCPWCRP